MSIRRPKKHSRDRALVAGWRTHPDSLFEQIGISRRAAEAAQMGMQGHLVFPGDKTYDHDRKLFNPLFDERPSVIALCETEEDARIALNLAWGGAEQLPFTIRSGGHSTAGFSASSGILIDVSRLKNLTIVPATMTVYAGPGVNFGTLVPALDRLGMHLPVGECDDVCIGGFMQGGGYGFTSGAFGMHCDHVDQVRVLLADGTFVDADETQNRDLWWAVRGGTGGNFGIVTGVKYRARSLGKIYGWGIRWPLALEPDREQAVAAMMVLQQGFMRTAPAGLTTQVSVCFQSTPPGGPETVPYLMIRGTYIGSAEDGRAIIQPLVNTAGAVVQIDMFDTFPKINDVLLNQPQAIPEIPIEKRGMPNEDKEARYVARDLTEAEWLAIFDHFITTPNTFSYLYFEIYGGAINAYPVEDSAFIHRDVAFDACLDVFWYPQDDRQAAEAYLQRWREVMEPMWNGRIYQNYPNRFAPNYQNKYWGDAFPALLAVKRKYDPQNFFRFPQMITPDIEAGAAPQEQEIWPPAIARALQEPIVRLGHAGLQARAETDGT